MLLVFLFLVRLSEVGRARRRGREGPCLCALGGGVGHGGGAEGAAPKETTGSALVSVAFCLPLGSKLDQGRKIHILLFTKRAFVSGRNQNCLPFWK